jgi:hypothetical protein
MLNCKLIVYYFGEMKIFTGEIIEKEPLKARIKGLDDYQETSEPCHMRLQWHENNSAHTAVVKPASSEGGVFVYDVVDYNVLENREHHYVIEHNSYFEIAKVSENNIGEIRHKVDNINKRFHNNLTNHVKKIILEEDLTNQYILKFLMQIDSKLDELMDSIKPESDIEGLKREKTFCISGGGFCFYSEKELQINDSVFTQSMPKEGSGLNFAAISKISKIIPAGKGYIYETSFDYIDENTRENIIHYIFEKDREKLKRKRN